MNHSIVIASSLVIAMATSCSKENGSAKSKPPATADNVQPQAASPHGPGGATQAAAGLGSGKVVETMNSGGYTYVKVDVGGHEIWAAGPETALAVGDTVSLPDGSPMPGYHSKTLDRTFDMIYFVSAIGAGGATAGGPANPHAGGMPANPHGDNTSQGKPPVVAVKIEGIAKAEGGKTVAEIFAGKKALGGQQVAVRGKVVKVNNGIMGRNWLHLQDGSGAAGNNDLTITTKEQAAVGDTVLVRGKVTLDKDFGAGYKYDVLLEDASITKE